MKIQGRSNYDKKKQFIINQGFLIIYMINKIHTNS